MGLEFTVNKELATASATLVELVSLTQAIKSHVGQGEFNAQFTRIMASLHSCYQVVSDNFAPWLAINSQSVFADMFDGLFEQYSANFLKEASKARPTVELIYEQYQELKTFKEFKTNYPLLKCAVSRLDGYIDKWIDNDTWFMMTLDRIFKMFSRFLQEISDFKRKDIEDAYSLFQPAIDDFAIYVGVIQQKLDALARLVK